MDLIHPKEANARNQQSMVNIDHTDGIPAGLWINDGTTWIPANIHGPQADYYQRAVTQSSMWEIYDSPGNAGFGVRHPAQVMFLRDNEIDIHAETIDGINYSGGLKLIDTPMTYGRVSLDAKVTGDPGEVTSGLALMWPADGVWPGGGEINITETYQNRDTRNPAQAYVHYPVNGDRTSTDAAQDTAVETILEGVDQSEWNRYTMTWLPNLVHLNVVAESGAQHDYTLTDDPNVIPNRKMHLALQLDCWSNEPLVEPVTASYKNILVEPLKSFTAGFPVIPLDTGEGSVINGWLVLKSFGDWFVALPDSF